MTTFLDTLDYKEYADLSFQITELSHHYDPAGLTGDASNTDNIAKLNHIADEQKVSEKQQDIINRIGTDYVYPSIELFTMIMADHADKLDWSDEFFMEYSIWIGHKFLKHSLAGLGEHWGMTRDAVRAVVRRLDRKDKKDDISVPMVIGIVWQAGEIAKCGRLV